VAEFNAAIAGNYTSFDEVSAPSKSIAEEKLNSFFEHIDLCAAGTVPIHGWIHDAKGRSLEIEILLDGQLCGRAEMGLSRTDVTDAIPEISIPNVGYRYNLDYRGVEPGIHTLEVQIRLEGTTSLRVTRQPLVVVPRTQERPPTVECADRGIPSVVDDPFLSGALDGPRPWTAALYNPVARLWLEYRNHVVRDYIEGFARIAISAGVPRDKIYSHQVSPALIGSWNSDLIAADSSRLPSDLYNQGTTLYGGAAFGPAFVAMKNALGWNRYGVGELHPLVLLSDEQYDAMFEMHRTNGATFVAPYFMNISPQRLRAIPSEHARFQVDAENERLASNAYWRAIQRVMSR
jgi:hypothetical protein